MENEKKEQSFFGPYNFTAKIPLGQAIPLGLQHVLAMFCLLYTSSIQSYRRSLSMPDPATSSAVLRVVVTTALGALPLAGASVTVSTAADQPGERTLLYSCLLYTSDKPPAATLWGG